METNSNILSNKVVLDAINYNLSYVVVDQELTILDVSDGFTKLSGYTNSDIKNKKILELFDKENEKKVIEEFEHARTNPDELISIECKIFNIDFQEIDVKIIVYQTIDDNGKKDNFFVIFKDIKIELELYKLKKKLLNIKPPKKEPLEFLTGPATAVLTTISKKTSLVIKILFLFIVIFLLYVGNAEIDSIVKGNGKLVPTEKIKHIKHLEGGVIKQILVKEGDEVIKGQILAKIDSTPYKTKYNENKEKLKILKARLIRLKAMFKGKKPNWIDCLKECDDNIIKREKEQYISSIKENQKKISQQLSKIKEQRSVLKDNQNKLKIAKSNYRSLLEEYNVKKGLISEGVVSLFELKKLKRDLDKAKLEIKTKQEEIKQTYQKIKEITNAIEEIKYNFKNKTTTEYNQILDQVVTLQHEQKKLKDIIKRCTIRSPIDGVINELFIHTIGTSIAPNTEILSIVPRDGNLLAKINIKPSDIGKLHIWQNVELKVTAFDYSIYGDLKGKIVNIAPDTIIDPNDKKEYFVVYVKPNKYYLNDNEEYKIKPGMAINASILIDKKTILSYLLKPILKSVQK